MHPHVDISSMHSKKRNCACSMHKLLVQSSYNYELIKVVCNSLQDEAWEERDLDVNKVEFTGRRKKRLCLVLDCLIPHNFSNDNIDLINLQHYVIKEKKLSEKEAIVIFADIIRVVESLHKVKKLLCLE